jgi:hypothetical protein
MDSDTLSLFLTELVEKKEKVIPKRGFSGKYLREMIALLDTIASTKAGLALLSSIERAGKDVKIRFPKLFVATYMKCNGGSPNTSKALGNPFREPIGAVDPLSALQQAARKSKLGARSIASFIRKAANHGGAKLGKVNEDAVTAWLDGSEKLPAPDDLRYRYLILAFEPWLDYDRAPKSRSSTIPGTS